jgi:hypothetical protein
MYYQGYYPNRVVEEAGNCAALRLTKRQSDYVRARAVGDFVLELPASLLGLSAAFHSGCTIQAVQHFIRGCTIQADNILFLLYTTGTYKVKYFTD